MGIIVHNKPTDNAVLWNMRVWEAAWDGNNVWDTKGTSTEDVVDFQLPDAQDSRKLQFKYHTTAPATGRNGWEADDFTRRPFLTSQTEIWTFESSPRILYQNPCPSGVISDAATHSLSTSLPRTRSGVGVSTCGILMILMS